MTTNGWAGDCGWRSPTFYMLLTGDSWRRLTRSPEAWRAATASKEIVRFVPRPTVGNGDSFMATLFTGLDNRRLLPPFPPVLWGEDLLFGVTLQLGVRRRPRRPPAVGGACTIPLEQPRLLAGRDGAQCLGRGPFPTRRRPCSTTSRRTPPRSRKTDCAAWARSSMEHGRMEPGGFDELARRGCAARAEAFAAGLEARLAAGRNGGEPAPGPRSLGRRRPALPGPAAPARRRSRTSPCRSTSSTAASRRRRGGSRNG